MILRLSWVEKTCLRNTFINILLVFALIPLASSKKMQEGSLLKLEERLKDLEDAALPWRVFVHGCSQSAKSKRQA